MTDSEKLDLILEKVAGLDGKVTSLDERLTNLEKDVTDLKADMIDVKSDLRRLHRDDELILDEVERVHTILERHMNNKSVHTA